MRVEKLTAAVAVGELPALTALLLDAVHSGASVGFPPPLTIDEARQCSNEAIHAVYSGKRILIAVFLDEDLAGLGEGFRGRKPETKALIIVAAN